MSDWQTAERYEGTPFTCTENGWMTSDIVFDWFKKFGISYTQRPLLLIYDGHATHKFKIDQACT